MAAQLSFWKLCCHWLKGLWHHHIASVIQVPGCQIPARREWVRPCFTLQLIAQLQSMIQQWASVTQGKAALGNPRQWNVHSATPETSWVEGPEAALLEGISHHALLLWHAAHTHAHTWNRNKENNSRRKLINSTYVKGFPHVWSSAWKKHTYRKKTKKSNNKRMES